MKYLRSVLAVLVGYLMAAFTAGAIGAMLFSTEAELPLVLRLLPGFLFLIVGGLAAGFLAAAIAGWAPLGHAAVVAALATIAGLMALAELDAPEPGWFLLLGTALEAPAVLVGGVVTARSSRPAERRKSGGIDKV
jgi:hypothetical protein